MHVAGDALLPSPSHRCCSGCCLTAHRRLLSLLSFEAELKDCVWLVNLLNNETPADCRLMALCAHHAFERSAVRRALLLDIELCLCFVAVDCLLPPLFVLARCCCCLECALLLRGGVSIVSSRSPMPILLIVHLRDVSRIQQRDAEGLQ